MLRKCDSRKSKKMPETERKGFHFILFMHTIVEKGVDYMSLKQFTTTDFQRQWLERLQGERENFAEHADYNDRHSSFPHRNVQTLVELGYTTLTLPKEYGGGGISATDHALFQEMIGSMDGATALAIGWHQAVVGEIYTTRLWTEEQLTSFAKLLKEGALVNRAMSEARTGSPARGGRPGTNAVRSENGWVLNGRKIFTTMSPALTHFLVSAWVEENNAIGTFLVPSHAEGLSIDETWDVVGMRASESHDLVLEDVYVEDIALVEPTPPERKGVVNPWALHTPACYLGIARAARDYAVNFSLHHKPNSIDTTISELPNVREHIGQMEWRLQSARNTLYNVAAMCDDDRRDSITTELAAAKHIVTNLAVDIVDRAMRLVGGSSLQMKSPLQRYYRDVRAGLHNPPMDDMVIQMLAAKALEKNDKVDDYR